MTQLLEDPHPVSPTTIEGELEGLRKAESHLEPLGEYLDGLSSLLGMSDIVKV